LEEKKSPLQDDLDNGTKKVGETDRKLAKGVRKTLEGVKKQAETEIDRIKNARLHKANLKTKQEGEGEDDGWESAEEDYQHIKLEELLNELTIHETAKAEETDEEPEDEDDGVPIVEESKK
jgi:hypothetical protein